MQIYDDTLGIPWRPDERLDRPVIILGTNGCTVSDAHRAALLRLTPGVSLVRGCCGQRLRYLTPDKRVAVEFCLSNDALAVSAVDVPVPAEDIERVRADFHALLTRMEATHERLEAAGKRLGEIGTESMAEVVARMLLILDQYPTDANADETLSRIQAVVDDLT